MMVAEKTLVTKIFYTKRGTELQRYWFTNYKAELVAWDVAHSNNLRGLLDSLFDTNRPMVFNSFFSQSTHRWPDFVHWRLNESPRFERFA